MRAVLPAFIAAAVLAGPAHAATPCPPGEPSVDGGAVATTRCRLELRHEAAVQAKINEYLKRALSVPGEIPLGTRVGTALSYAVSDRERDWQNPVLRDAEYYLIGLFGMTGEDTHALPVVGIPAYEVVKWAALRLEGMGYDKLEKWLRSDPNKPVSEPFGWQWAFRGLKDGAGIDGKKVVPPQPAKALPGLRIIP